MSASGGGRRKRHVEEEHVNHERWLVTYADMLTVLMALFIVMFAMSIVDKNKFDAFASGAKTNVGTGNLALPGGDALLAVQASNMTMDIEAAGAALEEKQQRESAQAQSTSDLERARAKILAALTGKDLQDSVSFRLDERGLVVTIVTDDVLFELGRDDLRPAGRVVLDAIVPTLKTMPNPVTVEGHTDNLPIAGGRTTNWELSTGRATSVLRYILETHHLPAQRLNAAGYADQRPIGPNTAAGRAANRRVEVVVRATTATTPATPATPGAPSQPGTAAAAPDKEQD